MVTPKKSHWLAVSGGSVTGDAVDMEKCGREGMSGGGGTPEKGKPGRNEQPGLI